MSQVFYRARICLFAGGMACLWGLFLLATPQLSTVVRAAPVAQLTPFPTPTPGLDGRILYIVQPNDTLWRISAITGVPLDQLRGLNKLVDDIVRPGDVLVIGYGGPQVATAVPGSNPTPLPLEPTVTAFPGTGNICVMLYLDENGDGMRQEEESWVVGGQINVSNRSGSVSESAPTTILLDDAGTPIHFCFENLPEGEFFVTVAIPEGYNPTTSLSKTFSLIPGDETFLSFGAQLSSSKAAETVLTPEVPSRSPILGILGGALLLIGLGLGVYAFLLVRKR